MSKKAKKIFSFVLSAVMFFSVFSLTAHSEQDGIFIYDISDEQAILTGIGAKVSGAVDVPEELGGYPVKIIDGAFCYKTKITSVTLPDSVISVNAYSFAYCSALRDVRLSSNLTEIGESAFFGCVSLESIEIPDSVTEIGSYAFYGCEKLSGVTLPSNISKISENVFNGCTSLDLFEIPEKVRYIGQDAFYLTGYYNDADNWEDDVLYIGEYLLAAKQEFSDCCTVKKGTRVIADGAFAGCERLSGIVIYDELQAVGEAAFDFCKNLTVVYYTGTSDQRRQLILGANNLRLTNALWYYGYCVPGDINYDGSVNNKDILCLFRYLSEWDVEVRENALDVNNDGETNNKDLTRLFQYVSGWNVRVFSKNSGSSSDKPPGGGDYGPVIIF